MKFVPPLWMLFLVGCGLLVHFYMPQVHLFSISVPWASDIVGVFLAVFGWFLTLWASNIFAREKTEILPTSTTNRVLITTGPYNYSRNPMYLGLVLMVIGIALYLGTLPMFISAFALFLILNFIFIRFEEGKLARLFEEQYRVYQARVRRWL